MNTLTTIITSNRRRKIVIQKETLERLYHSENRTQVEIAEILKCGEKTVAINIKDHGIVVKPAKRRNFHGEHNSRWSGNDATYSGIHQRVSRERGKPSKCEVCGSDDPSKKYEWANMTGNYHDLNDYKRMCVKCHRKHDGNEVWKFSPWATKLNSRKAKPTPVAPATA